MNVYYLHRPGCTRSKTMGDPTCYACRRFRARQLVTLRASLRRPKLKPIGHAYRDRIVAAAINVRSNDPSVRA
jgi:hypothetical protein